MTSSDSNEEPGRVTIWIDELKGGDSEALTRIWAKYFARLVEYSRRCFGSARRRVADEEDIAVTAFEALANGVRDGRFDLEDRHDLWQILVVLARRACVDQIRRQTAEKRGGVDVRGESIFLDEGQDWDGLDQAIDRELTPEFRAEVDERYAHLLDRLATDDDRRIARLKLEGWSNTEIASELDQPLRTIERRLARIRDTWTREIDNV